MNALELTFDEAGFSRAVRWAFENGYRTVAKNDAINTPKKLRLFSASENFVEVHTQCGYTFCLKNEAKNV